MELSVMETVPYLPGLRCELHCQRSKRSALNREAGCRNRVYRRENDLQPPQKKRRQDRQQYVVEERKQRDAGAGVFVEKCEGGLTSKEYGKE
ncbi:MAG TPA: hypothetical protein VJ550_05580 [Geomonas sp.]|nr:hypothetical protein [Geomonas sp.]